ncbi:sestrin 1/3 [Paragonimus westermani]|uniref:Sestrin 1/3 n=1 Tax=Paragonimus westermani TaxID=34504 RepID=A0A5J4NXN1_9TREM|nr:sestrin 1/3 [Paragonimus westermani]
MSAVCAKHCTDLFNRTIDSLNLLQGFWQRDEAIRQEDFQTLQRTFDSWYFGFGSPAVAGFLETVADDTGGTTLDTTMHGLIREQMADLLRISYTGPSGDIRTAAKDILLDLKTKKGFRIPQVQFKSPSYMINLSEMPHLECIKDEPADDENLYTTYTLFREYWFQWGRLENYICVMGFHPEYLECYMKMQALLFHADLPLPYPDRHYLAVLDQIYNLTHGGDALRSSGETLSLSELMHAVAILTHVHALACFIFGCGIRPEIDHDSHEHDQFCGGSSTLSDNMRNNGDALPPVEDQPHHCHTDSVTCSPPAASQDQQRRLSQRTDRVSSQSDSGQTIELTRNGNSAGLLDDSDFPTVRNRLCNSSVTLPYSTPLTDQLHATQLLQLIQKERCEYEEVDGDIVAEQFMAVTRLNIQLDSAHSDSTLSRAAELMDRLNQHSVISRFLDSLDSCYENFEGQPFHGVDRYILEHRFRQPTLADRKLNNIRGVDTSPYRRSVWNQVQSLFGICHDDFRYDCLDRLLSTTQRAFLKLCATQPTAINQYDHCFEKIFPVLSPSEVVHVILMVVEARQQACLLYALRAISECQACGHR